MTRRRMVRCLEPQWTRGDWAWWDGLGGVFLNTSAIDEVTSKVSLKEGKELGC